MDKFQMTLTLDGKIVALETMREHCVVCATATFWNRYVDEQEFEKFGELVLTVEKVEK